MTVAERVTVAGAVAILRLRRHDLVAEVAGALARGGLDVMELTLDDPGALEALRTLAAAPPEHALVGAGTVRTPEQVRAAADAGARFVVSPGLHPGVVETAHELGVEPLPGAATATEVAAALDRGARLVKLFPAGALGPGYLRALRGPFATAAFVATGGVGHDETRAWLEAGAAAVGLGSDLVPAVPSTGDLAGIETRAATVAAQVRAARA